jgi:hypothetical protein
MGPKRWIALVVGLSGAIAVLAMPAAAQAFPENGGTETATVQTPADGVGIAQTDQLPAKVTQADVTVTPVTDEQFFSRLSFALANNLNFDFAERVQACVVVTEEVVKNPNFFPQYTIPRDKTLQVLFLAACLQTALEVSLKEQQSHARTAVAGCFQTRLTMSLRYKRTGSGYSAQVGPTSKRPKQPRSRVRVTCRRTATGIHIKIRPRKRGQKLRSTVGPMLGLGVANPSSSPSKLRVSFTAK